ncbi:very large A-kinase anchor protein [Passer montanus]|uniref:very large A-kinase anchor protein n=1 Tax=Passer montanus TaxID=9160 RepID=UPI00195F8F3D|nr:very large A-kinase anchor protein [Passer montanus]
MSGGGSRRRAGSSWHSTFSRFFSRSPPGEGAANSSENKGSAAINSKSSQKESTTLPALLKACQNEEKNHSTEELSKSEIQEELKKANSLPSLTPGSKTSDKDKQPREGFFHFLGSLFNIATRSSLVESKPSTFQDEPNRCEKDLQSTNTFPKKDMQPKPKIEEPTARKKEDSVHKDGAILNNIGKDITRDLQGGWKQSSDTEKQTRRKAEAPAVTYATYRGSARIRQLLRNQSETGKREKSPENGNVSTVKENGEVQTTLSLKSGCLIEENGRDEGKDHQDDAKLNFSALRVGSKQSGKAQHCLSRSKRERIAKAPASCTESCNELHLRNAPALAATKVKRTYSLDSLLPFSGRNSGILTNSTSQSTHSLQVSSANDLIGKDDDLPGETGALFQTDKNDTSNFDKEIYCSKAGNKESSKEIQDNCLHSPKSKSKTVNEELQVGKGELCCNHQVNNHSERTLDVQRLHFSATTFQQKADQHTRSDNKDGDPRNGDAQKIATAVEREQNPQNSPATVLFPFNEQIPTSLSMESKGGKCLATGNLTASESFIGHDEDTVMGRGTCNEELSGSEKAVHVQNGHRLIHVENSKDTGTQQTGFPCPGMESEEAMKVLSEVAVENHANVSPCAHGCQSVKAHFDELTVLPTHESTSMMFPHSALRSEGRPLTNRSTFSHEKDDVDLISESPPVSESRCINFSSKKENSNKLRLSPTVIDSSSDKQGNMLPSATNSENGQIAASEKDSFIFPAAESGRMIPVNRMTEGPPCLGDLRTFSPANSQEPEIAPPMLDSCADGVVTEVLCMSRPTFPLVSREASNLPASTLEMSSTAQGNSNSSRDRASDGADEAFSTQQADSSVLAGAMPSPICPLISLGTVSESAHSETVCRDAVGQVILGASAPLEAPSGQKAAASAQASSLCSGKGQECSFPDAAVLLKKAEEIVDLVLHLATEEVIAKEGFGVCQLCGNKDGLINMDMANYQKAESGQLAAGEIQSAVQSLKDFNETGGGGSSLFTGNERVDTNNQDEEMLSSIPDNIDLHRVLELKAKETVDVVINSAIQKLASSQQGGTERKMFSGNIQPKPDAEMPKTLSLDMRFPANIQEPAEMAETQTVAVNCEKADCSSPPLLPNCMENGIGWPQKDEKVANNAIICQTNGFLSSGSLARPESDLLTPAKEKHNGKVCDHLAAAEMCGKVSAISRKSDGTLHFIDRDAAVTEEMLLPLQLKGSSNNTNMPECTLLPAVNVNLSSFMCGEECISLQSDSKYKSSPQMCLESNAGDSLYEHCGKEPAEEVPVQLKATLQNSKAVESEEQLAEGANEGAEVSTGLDAQSMIPELSVPGEASEGKHCFNTVFAQSNENLKLAQIKGQDMERNDELEENGLDCSNDMKEPTELLASSPLIEQWENSSFTIIYEGALQTENKSVSTDEMQTGSLSPSDLPSDDTYHLRHARAQKKQESVCLYGQDSKVSNAAESRGSESFLSVEAKRYRVYPFSLSPIYEDDSSQEDLLSTDVSPESRPGGVSKDSSEHTSVLSLLQSVSERLQFTARFSTEEEDEEDGVEEEEEEPSYEEDILDDEREENCLSSQCRGSFKETPQSNDQSRSFLEQSFLLSKEQLDSQEQPEQFPDVSSPSQTPCKPVPEKADAAVTQPPTSVYYQYLKSARKGPSEKGTRFGSILQDMLQPKIHWFQDNAVPKLGELSANLIDRASLKYNPRPGKIIIYDTCGNKSKQEVHSDVLDASSWIFPIGTVLRIIRGCWIFYEKPKFQGRRHVLEEGEAVLDHLWDLPGVKHRRNLTVGSIKHVTKDCGIPEVEFCPAAGSTEGLPICIQGAVANLEELDVEKNPYIRVRSGVWLAYSDLNYKGEMTVLEECDSPPEIPSADVKSLRPLRMGGLKVQMPMNVKIIIYEKTHFGGWSKEFSENITSVPALFGSEEEFQEIGSLRVIGGVWVAYDKERYKGHQFLLEEGDYEDRCSWGGSDSALLSFRFLQADFIESSVALFQSDDEDGKAFDIINEEIPDLEQVGFGPETRSILVKSGVWVAYQQKYFCGEQYVLEKGKYKCFFDWGGSSKTIMSIRPVKLEPLGTNEPPHLLKAFSNTHFQGACVDFTAEVSDFTSFIPCSFKVLRGCWLLCYKGETTDNHCVLEEGLYVDLSSCGCPTATIKSLKPIQYVFAEPSISLFSLECCKGRELHFSEAVNSVLNEDLHFYTQSVWVRSGLWIAYEGCNFLGKQILLEPREISNWSEHSGWKAIGSLRPVKQPAVYLRVRNRAQGKYLTVAGSLADIRATSVCAAPRSRSDSQLWHYCQGLLKSKANNTCLDVIGGRDVPGAKVALWTEHGRDRQKWRLNEDGTITSYLSEQLVLDIKGGNYYDKNHIIMNQPVENKPSQKWDIEIL